MTDNNSWQPPAGPPAEPTPPAPQPFVPPVAPAFPPPAHQQPFAPPQQPFAPPQQSQYGQPQAGFGQAPGWVPPPKPGLIPLRPLAFGTLLGASFQVMRRNPRPTFGVALVLSLISYALLAAAVGGVVFASFDRVNSAAPDDFDDVFAGAVGLGILAALIPLLLSVVLTAVMQGIVSLEVARSTVGEKLRFRGLWRLARGRIGALIGWAVLTSVVVYGAIILVAIVATLIGILGGAVGILIAVLVGLASGLALVVVGAWLFTKLSLVPTILLLERRTLPAAIKRSWSLTNGYFWKTLGVQLLVGAIVSAASQVISTPVGFIGGLAGSLLNPNGDPEGEVGFLVLLTVISGLIGVVFQAITIVTMSAVSSLIYVDIRMRKEGLDLELARFVEARQAGDTSVENPYATADVTSTSYLATPPPADGSPWV